MDTKTLFQLSADMAAIEDALWENGGELTDDLALALQETEQSIVKKTDGYISLLLSLDPFFVHCEAVLEKGPHILPVVPNYTKALYWTSKDGCGSLVIKAGQQTFVLPENAFCEMTIYTEPTER